MLKLDVVEEILAETPATIATSATKPELRGIPLSQPLATTATTSPLRAKDNQKGRMSQLSQPPATVEGPMNSGLSQLSQLSQPVSDYLEFLVAGLRADGLQVVKDDVDFLRMKLPKDNGRRRKLLAEYRCIWLEIMDETPLEHQKQNAGRFAANTWLREIS